MTNQKIIFWGTSEFAVPIVEKLAHSQWRPVLVVSAPDAPAGRGVRVKSPPVKSAAERLKIRLIQPEKLTPIPPLLSAEEVDLFIVAAYGKILPPALLKIPKFGSLNVHPSLLPRWRGPSPIQSTILGGDTETGVTIILMDEKVDHGPIIKSSKLEIKNPKVATPELTGQLAALGMELLLATIPQWLEGKIKPQVQDESQATYSRLLNKEDGRIDWACPAETIERMVRALTPWPGTFTFWQKGGDHLRLQIEDLDVVSDQHVTDSNAPNAPPLPGTVFIAGNALMVSLVRGRVTLKMVKPEGGRSMTAAEFLRGHPDFIGAILN